MKAIDLELVRKGDALVEKAKAEGTRAIPETEFNQAWKGKPMEKEVYSAREAAELLGMTPVTLKREIRKGNLKAAKLARDWRISKVDLEDYYRKSGGGELFQKNE